MMRLRWLMVTAMAVGVLILPVAVGAQPADKAAAIAEKMTSEDQAVRGQAFKDLLAMGDQGVRGMLRLLVEPGKGDDAGARMALHGLAMHVSRPAAEKERATFVKALIAHLDSNAPSAVKAFVIRQLHIAGREDCVPALAGCLLDEELSEPARQALVVNPSPAASKALRDAVPKTEGATRASIIQALGYRQDTEAVPLLIREANSNQPEVRLAAVESLGRIGDARAESVIAAQLNKGDKRQRRTAFDAYVRLAEQLLQAGRKSEASRIYTRATQAAPEGHLRAAALLGLAEVGTPGLIRVMLPHVADADPRVRQVAMACLAEMPGGVVSREIAAAMKTADPQLKGALLRLLAQREEPEATAAIEAAAQDPNLEVRVTALHLLHKLDDPALEPTLLEAAERGSDLVRPIALEALMRLAGRRVAAGEKDAALAVYTRALELAKDDALRSMALRGLADVADPKSLPKVAALLEDEAVRGDALRAYVAIAAAVAQAGDKQGGIDMLRRALAMSPPRDVADRAVAELRKLGIRIDPAMAAGFVTTWWIMGSFPGSEIDKEWPPEQAVDLGATVQVDDRELGWHMHHTTDTEGRVNLDAMMDPNENSTAYLYAEVTVEQAQDVLLKMGSDDGMKCWLNGQLVHRFPEPRSLTVDQDAVKARLNAGANKLLLKIVEIGGGWECCLRLTDPDGRALKFEQKEE